MTTWTMITAPPEAAPEPFQAATLAEAQARFRALGWVVGEWGHPFYWKAAARDG